MTVQEMPPTPRMSLLARWRAWRLRRRECGFCMRQQATVYELEQRIDQGATALMVVLHNAMDVWTDHYNECHMRGADDE